MSEPKADAGTAPTPGPRGNLTLDALTALVKTGEIDTVTLAVPWPSLA